MSGIITAMILFVYLGRRRKFYSSKTIVTEFEPPKGLSPMMMGILQDKSFSNDDILGGVIALVEKGLLSIKKIENPTVNYEIGLQKDGDQSISESEKLLLEILFGKNPLPEARALLLSLSGIERLWDVVRLQKHLCQELESLGLVKIIRASITGTILIKRTKTGDLLRDQILGFVNYLETVYKYKYKEFPIPTLESKHVAEFLLFAVALGVATDFVFEVQSVVEKQQNIKSKSKYSSKDFYEFIENIKYVKKNFQNK